MRSKSTLELALFWALSASALDLFDVFLPLLLMFLPFDGSDGGFGWVEHWLRWWGVLPPVLRCAALWVDAAKPLTRGLVSFASLVAFAFAIINPLGEGWWVIMAAIDTLTTAIVFVWAAAKFQELGYGFYAAGGKGLAIVAIAAQAFRHALRLLPAGGEALADSSSLAWVAVISTFGMSAYNLVLTATLLYLWKLKSISSSRGKLSDR